MTIKDLTEQISGLRHIIDGLEILSGPGKRMLRQMPVMTSAAEVDRELDAVAATRRFVSDAPNADSLSGICHILMCLNDISATVRRLAAGDVLDDIELFEIKTLAIQAASLRRHVESSGLDVVRFESTDEAVSILDPEKTGVPHFFVYDAYSDELASLRRKLKSLPPDSEEAALVYCECAALEDGIRAELSRRLFPHAPALSSALDAAGRLDLLIARARQAMELNLCRPTVKDSGDISYGGLFNPVVAEQLAAGGGKFQPVDISVSPGVCLITGANMGGKSVVLKTLALSQAMAQSGLFVPAGRAEIAVVDAIMTSMGDGQSELSGLSSFAAEMLAINDAVKAASDDSRLLILIDEPARTTNPEEGKAIVAALLDYFAAKRAYTVMTTHYSGLHASRHLRVKGLSRDILDDVRTPADINSHMDYSLVEASDSEIPREALRIASMLGFDAGILDFAARSLDNE